MCLLIVLPINEAALSRAIQRCRERLARFCRRAFHRRSKSQPAAYSYTYVQPQPQVIDYPIFCDDCLHPPPYMTNAANAAELSISELDSDADSKGGVDDGTEEETPAENSSFLRRRSADRGSS